MLDKGPVGDAIGDIIDSITQRMGGFLYRCCNDRDYSMIFMAGGVEELTGYPVRAFTGAERRSYAALTHKEDLDAVFAAVDQALAERRNWAVDYRIVSRDGRETWVHEIGGGVFEGEDLVYLEGVVVNSDERRRAELRNIAMLEAISDKSRLLLKSTVPIVNVLRTLRILAINARLEAGRAGPAGASFGYVANEVSRLSEETAQLAEAIATITGELNGLVNAG
jgi:hypothetical protein